MGLRAATWAAWATWTSEFPRSRSSSRSGSLRPRCLQVSPLMKALLPLLLLLACTACVRFTSQRLTFVHLPQQDELQVLILYDGVHHDGTKTPKEVATRIEAVLEGRELVLSEWPFAFQLELVEATARRKNAGPALRSFCATLLENLKVQPLGRFDNPDGQLCAAVQVRVTKFQRLLASANAALRELVLADPRARLLGNQYPGSGRLLAEWARAQKDFLAFEGQALRCMFPVEPREWQVWKVTTLRDHLESMRAARPAADTDPLLQLAGNPIGLEESGGQVTVTIGNARSADAQTLRLRLRDQYEDNLRDPFTERVPALTPAMLPAFAPREELARPWIDALRAAATDPAAAAQAQRQLQEFARRWSESRLEPATPGQDGDLAAWRSWYRRAAAFPFAAGTQPR